MPQIQIGKYSALPTDRVYIEEYDNSLRNLPNIDAGIVNLAIGFSKKGAINRPVLLKSLSDLEVIYGPLDRQLEKHGSYFHRTIAKMLEVAPVFALNIVNINDTLDKLDYISMSSSTDTLNDAQRQGPYKRFFDVTGFWKRSRARFLDYVEEVNPSNERLLNFVNLGDRKSTIFIFKSKVQGYDIDMLKWFGTADKIPTYLRETDFVSDFMVDMLIVSGDFTNYEMLAIDPRWSNYFNKKGLRKDKVDAFRNDTAVNTLRFFDGMSLIPFFKDSKGSDIFIETVVNRFADLTGVFCAFNMEAFETDYPNGYIDLIGNNLIDSDVQEVNFLSYKDMIIEKVDFPQVKLDYAGNTISFGGPRYRDPLLDRAGFFAEGYVNDTIATLDSLNATITFTVGSEGYAVINGKKVDLIAGNYAFEVNPDSFTGAVSPAAIPQYSATYVITPEGYIKRYENKTNANPYSVSTSEIVLGFATFFVQGTNTGANIVNSYNYTDVTIDSVGFIDLQDSLDFVMTVNGTNGDVYVEFLGTDVAQKTSDYIVYRRFKLYNYLVSKLGSPFKERMVLLDSDDTKVSLSGIAHTFGTATNGNKNLLLQTGLSASRLAVMDVEKTIIIYVTDNEFIMGTNTMLTKNELPTASEGVTAKYSSFYERFRDGITNTGDYFYKNRIAAKDANGPVNLDVQLFDYNGDDYIAFFGDDVATGNPSTLGEYLTFVANDQIVLPESSTNTGTLTIIDPTNKFAEFSGPGELFDGYSAADTAVYLVNENVKPEVITNVTKIYNAGEDNKVYLRMYLNGSGVLKTELMDKALESSNPVSVFMKNIEVFSQKNNYKQTVEIENVSGFTMELNKILISASRYTEIKKGGFLLAEYDTDSLEVGQVAKKITRILSKKLYSADSNYVEIVTDAPIKMIDTIGDTNNPANRDLQTTYFTSLEDYITTYNGISLAAFSVRKESAPNGTEERQTELLNMLGRETNLFEALTNKEIIDFRYLVDTFGLGLVENSKHQLAAICGERGDCFGILNMPSMYSFKKSANPVFTDLEGVLNMEFVRLGGDPESNPAFLYSFVEGNDASSVGYFAPYVTTNDNGRPVSVPPAAFIAQSYMQKHVSNQGIINKFSVVAGVITGQVKGITGVEMDFSDKQLSQLTLMKANPIVTKKNRGYALASEFTAQTNVNSALSNIHAREILIELERDIKAMLENFLWKYNTPEVRAEIKLRADQICDKYFNLGALTSYFNLCDQQNNTDELIDNQIGVLNTYVTIPGSMSRIVAQITVLKSGTLSSGFIESLSF